MHLYEWAGQGAKPEGLCDNCIMSIYQKAKVKFIRSRMQWRKRKRLFFPSPAEVEFIRIFGGKYITVGRVRDPRTGFPLTIITSLGSILRRELIKREVRVGRYFVDFGTLTRYYKKGIEVDGRNFHQDIVKEQTRDDYFRQFGWQLFHIQAASVFREPQIVQRKVLEFLAS